MGSCPQEEEDGGFRLINSLQSSYSQRHEPPCLSSKDHHQWLLQSLFPYSSRSSFLGMEKVAAKSRSSQAKIIGSIVSIAGAFVVTFYKGPSINIAQSRLPLPTEQHIISFPNSVDTTWVIAGTLLTADYLLVSLCYIWQAEILKADELTVVFFYNVTATIVSVTVALFTERNASAWEIGLDISLVSIICSGIFGKLMSNAVNAWALRLKGAVYVATFQPLSIVIATAMGVVFLGDALYIGSIIGAAIISIGFYTVLWGKATEEKEEEDDDDFGNQESLTIENVPLLQSYKTVNENVHNTSTN
ncbi:hypothetical protein PIB30_035646 [Stylosanthes scabra]|uniref:WAT1-related protein n=1 Tax=Stylosanthes scabra TaxID=79078 RepID=A0ABU6QCN3_9FABA|nr:hypothetical protein [Stylosanthes scabra]